MAVFQGNENDDVHSEILSVESQEESKEKWPPHAVMLFLELYQEHLPLFSKSTRKSIEVWGMMIKKLEEKNLQYTRSELQRKWSSLKDTYKKRKERSGKTGAAANCYWEYEIKMDEILHGDPSVSPVCVLQTHGKGGLSGLKRSSGVLHNSPSPTPQVSSPPLPSAKRQRFSPLRFSPPTETTFSLPSSPPVLSSSTYTQPIIPPARTLPTIPFDTLSDIQPVHTMRIIPAPRSIRPVRSLPTIPPTSNLPNTLPCRSLPTIPPTRNQPKIPPVRSLPAIPATDNQPNILPTIPPTGNLPNILPTIPPTGNRPNIVPVHTLPGSPPAHAMPDDPPIDLLAPNFGETVVEQEEQAQEAQPPRRRRRSGPEDPSQQRERHHQQLLDLLNRHHEERMDQKERQHRDREEKRRELIDVFSNLLNNLPKT